MKLDLACFTESERREKRVYDRESPLGFRGVEVEGVALGESPTADAMMKGMPDFSASTGSLRSGSSERGSASAGVRPAAKQMTVRRFLAKTTWNLIFELFRLLRRPRVGREQAGLGGLVRDVPLPSKPVPVSTILPQLQVINLVDNCRHER